MCYLCTYVQCGNILSYGTCLYCNSGIGNSFTYDPIPESFDEVQIILDPPPQWNFNIYLCQICESNSHYGYECLQRVLLVYEPEPCYIQNFSDNDYSHDLLGVNPLIDHHCCYKCGNSLNDLFCHHCTCEFCGNGTHVGYNCPAQVPSFQTLPSFPQQYLCCDDCEFIQKKHEEEQAANARYWKILACSDDDDDYNSAITPNEPVDSLSMGDEHLNTILATESDELIKSCVKNLVPNPSESEGESGCDVPACFTTFSNILFDADYNFYSVNNQSLSDEDVLEKIFSNLYNSSPRLPEEFVSENSNAEIESFSPSPIPIKDSESLMEEIDLSFTLDDLMSPCIEEDDDDSERDILICKELLDNYSLSLAVIESYHFDIPSFSCLPAKPPDGNTGILNIKMMGDIFEQKVPIPGLTITRALNQKPAFPLLLVSWKFEDSYQRILSSKSSFPQL
nr:hypothetical protein [Tanacetum cinerariifolium]